MYSVLIADDHEVVRLGMKLLVTEALGICNITFVSDGKSLFSETRQNRYDLLISDINMPNMDGAGDIKTILAFQPTLKILIISVLPENIYGLIYLKAGAYGYLEKESPNHLIKKAIQAIISDKKYFSQELLTSYWNECSEGVPSNRFSLLGDRELEVIMLLMKGKPIGEAAAILGMHISTASTHKTRAFKKLEVQNLRELIDLAKLNRII